MNVIKLKLPGGKNTVQLFLVAVLSLLFTGTGFGQEIGFLPEGAIGLSYDFESSTANSGYNSYTQKKSLRKMLANRHNIDEQSIGGDISLRSIQQNLSFQYGLFETLNIGVTLPYVSNSRESSLTVKDSNSAETTAFVDSYESAESSGIGDYELWGIWRLVYTDSMDFQFGFSFVGDNAPYYYNDTENVAIGSGSQEFLIYFRWLIYPNNVDIIADIEVNSTSTIDGSVEDPDGNSYELRRGTSIAFHANFSKNLDAFNFGGGLNGLTTAETQIDGSGISDSGISYTFDLFLNFGNLHQLEVQDVTLPWMVRFDFESVIYGVNTTADVKYGIKALFYF